MKVASGPLCQHSCQITWNNNYWIKFGDWLAEPRYSASYEKPKIIIRQTGDSLIATYDEDKFIVRDNLYTIVNIPEVDIPLQYILGLINSKFMNWYYQNIINNEKGEALAQVKRGHIAILPIPFDKSYEHEIVALVNNLILTNRNLLNSKSELDIKSCEQKINILENKINDIVFSLFKLEPDKIKIIESN